MRSQLLALLCLTAPAAAQSPLLPVSVLLERAPIAPGIRVESIDDVTAGPAGGYAAAVLARNDAGTETIGLLWGDPIDDGATSPSILRRTGVVAGRTQTSFESVGIGGGRIAYVATIDTPGGPRESVWIDDQLELLAGTPTPVPGLDYLGFYDVEVSVTGDVTAGAITGTPPLYFSLLVVDVASGTARLAPGDPVPGTQWSIFEILEFDVSPSGAHLAAEALLVDDAGNGRVALLLDGSIVEIDGVEVLDGNLVPPRAGGDGSVRFETFSDVAVDDLGRVAFTERGDLGGFGRVVRDGDLVAISEIDVPLGRLGDALGLDMDPRGRVASTWRQRNSDAVSHLLLDDRWLAGPDVTRIDLDGDGSPNGVWVLQELLVPWRPAITLRGDVFVRAEIGNGVAMREALLRLRASPGRQSCDAQPNSTGVPSQLVGLGPASVASNEFELLAYDLPPNVPGYLLASRQSGLTPGAGGSSGDLCLGGPIGRYADRITMSGVTGEFDLDVDLASVPQPMGSASVLPGETWYFQAWHRDSVQGVATSNFTPALEVEFD